MIVAAQIEQSIATKHCHGIDIRALDENLRITVIMAKKPNWMFRRFAKPKKLPPDSGPNAANRQSDCVDKPATDIENTGRFLPVRGTIVPPAIALNGRGQIPLLSTAPLSGREEWSAHGCDQNFRPRRSVG